MLERYLERYFVKECKNAGALCYKFSSPMTRGVCDRIVIYMSRVYFVELKTESISSKLSPLQIKFMKDLEQHNLDVLVMESKLEVDNFIKYIKNRKKKVDRYAGTK